MKRVINLLKRKMKKLQNSTKKIPVVLVRNYSEILENDLYMLERSIQNSVKHPKWRFFGIKLTIESR